MGNEGKFIAIIPEKDADKALNALHGTAGGENAALIGHMQAEKGLKLLTRLGGRRVLGPLYGEGLPRIC
jgi:hydrogenase expression/formation protein HypE